MAKRQRRRLLSAPPQVRVLPLVPDTSPSPSWTGSRPLKAETRVRIPPGTLRPCRPVARSPPSQGGEPGPASSGEQARLRPRDRYPAGSPPTSRVRSRRGWRTFTSRRGFESRRDASPRRPMDAATATNGGFRGSTPRAGTAPVAPERGRSHQRGSVRAAPPARAPASKEGRGPTNRETGVRFPQLAPRDPCSRKHLVRLPGCLPGEAGSIPVDCATFWPVAGASGRGMSGRIGFDPRRQDESAWRNWHTRRAQASLPFRVRIPERSAIVAERHTRQVESLCPDGA